MCDCDGYEAPPDRPADDADPCPFCGGSDTLLIRENLPHVSYVVCGGCAAEGPVGGTGATAIRLWNDRRKS